MIRTLLVLEGRLVRGALAHLLSRQADLRVVGEFDELTEVEATTIAERPDVTVVDHDVIRAFAVRERLGRPRMLTLVDRCHARRLAGMMASYSTDIGFVGKDATPQRVIDGIRRLAQGEIVIDAELVAAALGTENPLTAREGEVLAGVGKGLPVCEIAMKFGLSPGTVRNHLSRIFAKTGTVNSIQAVRKARESGWI